MHFRLFFSYIRMLLRMPLFYISIALVAFTSIMHFIYDPIGSNDVVGAFSVLFSLDAYRKMLPLYCAIPFTGQFVLEQTSNYNYYICSRLPEKKYCNTVFIVNIISSFLVCFLGIMLYIMMGSFVKPLYIPEQNLYSLYGIFLELNLPWVFLGIKTVIYSLSCSFWTTCGLVFSVVIPNRYVAICAPFICSYLIEYITEFLPSFLDFNKLAVGVDVLGSQNCANNLVYNILIWIVCLGVMYNIFLFVFKEVNYGHHFLYHSN